jgi:hypothetical protein
MVAIPLIFDLAIKTSAKIIRMVCTGSKNAKGTPLAPPRPNVAIVKTTPTLVNARIPYIKQAI